MYMHASSNVKTLLKSQVGKAGAAITTFNRPGVSENLVSNAKYKFWSEVPFLF